VQVNHQYIGVSAVLADAEQDQAGRLEFPAELVRAHYRRALK
jgi:hypothetical protein